MANTDAPTTDPADRWIGVALDAQIRPGSSHPASVDGTSVAIWRGETGPAQVWADRCPHRGTRLSFGFVRGDILRCIYHGWGFAADGQCAQIPAHPDLTPPKTLCATVHRSATRYGIIWTNLAPAPSADLPDLAAPGDWRPVRSLYVDAAPAAAKRAIAAYPFADQVRAERLTDTLLTVAVGAGLQLLFAVQPIAAHKTGLHIAATGPGADQRESLARQMTRLRHTIESEPWQ